MQDRTMPEFCKNRARVQLGGVLAGMLVAALATPAMSQEAARRSAAAETPDRQRWTVVLDPGHGGIDKGAVGSTGLEEKAVVLSIARVVRRFLVRDSRFRILLTRNGDRYVRLQERYEFARRHRAALFVSIHADANPFVGQRGLSVHTLSARASDRLAARLAERVNRSDAIAGVDLRGSDRSVSAILLDLVRRETRAGSTRISSLIVRSARDRVRLLSKPRRSADFAVLRAPDVPSVLVELGFLTNAQDEELLRTMTYRKRLAAVLARAIAQYFSGAPAAGKAGNRAFGAENSRQ
ncbi:MAG: N-acetylmuramoyl-L-alanine amidase [Rhodospirillaceae bacterium]|nr:N-acetylmuramoyl-L-alanine amidase [Rhodospirillaceae bacterium]